MSLTDLREVLALYLRAEMGGVQFIGRASGDHLCIFCERIRRGRVTHELHCSDPDFNEEFYAHPECLRAAYSGEFDSSFTRSPTRRA